MGAKVGNLGGGIVLLFSKYASHSGAECYFDIDTLGTLQNAKAELGKYQFISFGSVSTQTNATQNDTMYSVSGMVLASDVIDAIDKTLSVQSNYNRSMVVCGGNGSRMDSIELRFRYSTTENKITAYARQSPAGGSFDTTLKIYGIK